ncbi:YihY family inner membrane protein [Nitrincola iocasae]|uniref:YihY family inner membrane protein n=1 Tax=Nitrincola iocasae TaxID=2614693 RepID=UPI002D7999ED|nr:YihY family inner membrane protein [Nitrincola iocasae]
MNIKSITGSSILLFIRDLIRQFFINQGILNASALTYTTLFAVVPLVTVSYSMLAAIPTFQGAGDIIQQWVFENFVPATGQVVHEYLSDFTTQARRLTAVGVVFLVITSIMMMKNIEAALNRIWRVSEPRKGVSSFLLYWAVLSLGPFLVGLGLLVTSYITALPAFSTASEVVGQGRMLALVPVVFSAVAFMLLYAAVPNCQVPLKNAFIGGVAAALSFEAAKRGFAFFVTQFPSYELIYGAFAAVPMFLAWVFVCWVIILMGAELSRALTIYQITQRNRSEPHLYTVLGVLNRLWYAQQQGRALSDTELLQQTPGLDQGRWDGYVQLLLEADVIRRTDSGSYLLARDLNRFSLEQLRALMPWPIPDAVDNPEARPWELQLSERLAELSRTRTELLEIDLATLFSVQDTKS